eukprot:SAG25_NODE_613_length_6536_cov_28.178033_3_plen_31_part_00
MITVAVLSIGRACGQAVGGQAARARACVRV